MEAKELMINDWYKNSANEFCKVVKNFGDIVWGEGDDVADSTDNPLPILLTEDILRKNGFTIERTPERFSIFYLKGKFVFFGFEYDVVEKDYWVSLGLHRNIVFKYVHELQHILRLAGLSELADNFKV